MPRGLTLPLPYLNFPLPYRYLTLPGTFAGLCHGGPDEPLQGQRRLGQARVDSALDVVRLRGEHGPGCLRPLVSGGGGSSISSRRRR